MLLRWEANFSWSPEWGQILVQCSLFHSSQWSCQITDITVFLENIKQSTHKCWKKQNFLSSHRSSPSRATGNLMGELAISKWTVHYGIFTDSSVKLSALLALFWSTKEKHAPLKENYFDAAGTVPSLKRLMWKRASNRQWWEKKERRNKMDTFSQTLTSYFSISAVKCSYSREKLSMSFSKLCQKKNLFGLAAAGTQEKANSRVFIGEQVVTLYCMNQISHCCHPIKLQRLTWIYSLVKPAMEYP